jgi:hypothetical protein
MPEDLAGTADGALMSKGGLTRRRLLGGAIAGGFWSIACGGKRAEPAAESGVPSATAVAGARPTDGAISAAATHLNADAGVQPSFSDVAQAGPDQVGLFFGGVLASYPGVTIDNYLGYSPADILESMDTAWLDDVGQDHGDPGVQQIYGVVAQQLLDSLLAVYGSQPVVLALDAGHGGNPSVFYDPGSDGTEAQHTRNVVELVEQLARDSRYASLTLRRIFNDAIPDDFGLPPPEDNKTRAQLVLRNGRASMLAYEVRAWNQLHAAAPVALHVLSVHFNANSGGTLVLHQGDDVPEDYQRRSLSFAQDYVPRARAALNATGLLRANLDLVDGTGLHDDSLMYPPPIRAGGSRVNPLTGNPVHGPPRYAMLQASLLEQDYVLGLLRYRGLA